MSVLIAGRFDLRDKIGEGTFAEVWRAVDTQGGGASGDVALKIFYPSAEGDANHSWEPVFREVAAGLRMGPHPHVLRTRAMTNVRFFGEQETPCLVMDYVLGRNLALWLADQVPLGPHNLEPRIHLMSGLLNGLAHAHASGVAHQDISFGNTLVHESEPPRAVLTDFGCSQTEDLAPVTGTEHEDPATLQPINPPPYLCHLPLAEGTCRDIYAFGILCSLVLTGRHPLTDDWQSMRTGQWTGLPFPHRTLPRRPLTELSPWMRRVPRLVSLSDLLLRCVSADPRSRPESAPAVQAQWGAIMSGPS